MFRLIVRKFASEVRENTTIKENREEVSNPVGRSIPLRTYSTESREKKVESERQKAAGGTLSLLFAEAANDPSKAAYKSFNRRSSFYDTASRLLWCHPRLSFALYSGWPATRVRLFAFSFFLLLSTINLAPRKDLSLVIGLRRGMLIACEIYVSIVHIDPVLSISWEFRIGIISLTMDKIHNGCVFSSLMSTNPMDRNIDPTLECSPPLWEFTPT